MRHGSCALLLRHSTIHILGPKKTQSSLRTSTPFVDDDELIYERPSVSSTLSQNGSLRESLSEQCKGENRARSLSWYCTRHVTLYGFRLNCLKTGWAGKKSVSKIWPVGRLNRGSPCIPCYLRTGEIYMAFLFCGRRSAFPPFLAFSWFSWKT